MTRLSTAELKRLGLLPGKKKKPRERRPAGAKWDVTNNKGSIIIIIPGALPSMNVWKNWHWSKYQAKIQELAGDLRMLKLAFRIPLFQRPRVQVVYYFRTNRRRDKDNFTPKLLLDALRYSEIIAEDNAEVLELLPVEFRVDTERPRVVVWIKERD